MDGKTLRENLREMLLESGNSDFINDYQSYWYISMAVNDFNRRTSTLTDSETITTVADQAAYTLASDFANLYIQNDRGEMILKYTDASSNNYFLMWKDYGQIFHQSTITSQLIPTHFCVRKKSDLTSSITGTTTSASTATGGETTLTDTVGDFTNVNEGDMVHNIDDGSRGVVISKTSTTVLVTALFEGSSNNWGSGDTYRIVPQSRQEIYLDPPPSTAGHTITVPYVKNPAPVYSDYRRYNIADEYIGAILHYAAFMYEYRDKKPDLANNRFVLYDALVKGLNRQVNTAYNRRGIKVNLRSRR